MDRIALLKSLPFLNKVCPTTGPKIWKEHWSILTVERNKAKDDNTSENELFTNNNHALSIEPIDHNTLQSAGVAFFSSKKRRVDGWNETDSTADSANDKIDPALSNFHAYLLPASLSTSDEENTDSTSLSRDSESQKQDTKILYFFIEGECFCVDHLQIRSIEVEEARSTNENSKELRLPMSMIFSFDSCNFRVLSDDSIMDSESNFDNQELSLQQSFKRLKEFMTSEGTKIFAEYRTKEYSFQHYLALLRCPLDTGSSQPDNHYENGQTTTVDSNSLSTKDQESAEASKDHEIIRQTGDTKDKLESYHKSLKALQTVHSLFKLKAHGKIPNKMDSDDLTFVKFVNKCALECSKSFVDMEDNAVHQTEAKTNEAISEVQESIDEIVGSIFPAKRGLSMTPTKRGQDEFGNTLDFEAEMNSKLENYRSLVIEKHRMLGFVPRR